MKKHLKPHKIIASLAILGFCLSFSNVSCADTIQDNSLNTDLKVQEITTNAAEISSNNNIINNQTEQRIIPAINKIATETQVKSTNPTEINVPYKHNLNINTPSTETGTNETDKNIVPILDLKGGVQSQEIKKETPLEIWLHADKATGDWNGLRTKLEDNGITLSGSYMMNPFTKMRRGGLLDRRKPTYQGLVNTSVEFNTEKMHLYPGGKLFVLFQNIHGVGLTDKYVGDYMYLNGYDSSRHGPQLSEYWYEQRLFKDKLKFKVGKQDANSDFQALDTGFLFLNSGFEFMVNSSLPTYPEQSMGLVTTIQPTDNTYLKYGFFDGNGVGSQSGFNTVFHKGDSYMHLGELGATPSINNHPGKYLIGGWIRTEDTEQILDRNVANSGVMEPGIYSSNHGIYTEFEQMIFKEKPDSEDDQGLTVLGQFSWAPSDRNELSKYFGTALAYKGLIPKRDNDTFGVGMNFAKFSNKLGAKTKGENVLEILYKIQLTPWLYIQPDIQYINKPYYADKSTFVFGLRTNFDI